MATQDNPVLPVDRLTPKEKEIMRLLPDYPSRRIAGKLGIKNQTVKNHLRDIFTKTGASNSKQLCYWIGSGRFERMGI